MKGIVRAELLKVRTTNVWWLIALGALLAASLAFALNAVVAHFMLAPPGDLLMPDATPEQESEIRRQMHDQWVEAHSVTGLARTAANLYTSGRYLGLMLVMLLGALAMTNEFRHHTATTTFLATPRRARVVAGKAIVAALLGSGFWLGTTAVNVGAGVVFFHSEGVTNSLGRWDVTQALLLSLAGYVLWAVLGVGLGVLMRHQIGAVVTGTVGYVLSLPAGALIVELIHNYLIKDDWVYNLQVLVPGVATDVMLTPVRASPQDPPQYLGAVALIAYCLATGIIGTIVIRRRDIA